MSPAGVLLFTLTWITLVAAVDTAVALFLSSNCATAEKPFLVLPGSEILSGNCVDDLVIDYLAPDWKSIQVISLGGDCSVYAYYDKSCEGGVARVNANECVLFDSKPAEAVGISDDLPIRSFRINGGNCKLPSKAVLSTSVDVPAASSTRTADPMNTVISAEDGPSTAAIASQTTLYPGPSSGTSTIRYEEIVPTASSNAAAKDPDSGDSKLSTILAATIIPTGAISALGLLWCFYRRKPSRSRQKEHVSLSTSTSSSTQNAAHTGASACDHSRQHNGNVYHYYGGSGDPSRNESPVSPGQIGSHLR